MSMITKNALVSVIVVVIGIGIVALIVKMRRGDNNTTPKPTTMKEGFSIENFPQSVPMNVMYSDASGNLSTTTDLGLKNLTVTSDSSFGGNVGVTGKVSASSSDVSGSILLGNKFRLNGGKDLYADDDWLRIMNKENTGYGGGIAAKKLWSEGDASINGSASVAGSLSAGSVNTSSVNIYNYGDVRTKLDELFARVKTLEDNTVKKNQRFSLEQTNTWSGGNNTWYKIAMSDACYLKAINAGCGGTNWGDNNNFRIIQ